MLVQQILNSKANDDVITVQPETTLVEAAAILASNKIGTVVISEDGKINNKAAMITIKIEIIVPTTLLSIKTRKEKKVKKL